MKKLILAGSAVLLVGPTALRRSGRRGVGVVSDATTNDIQ
jgi:hypothetical protein